MDLAAFTKLKEEANQNIEHLNKSLEDALSKSGINESRINAFQLEIEKSVASLETRVSEKVEVHHKASGKISSSIVDQIENKIVALEKKCSGFMEETNGVLTSMQSTISNDNSVLSNNLMGLVESKIENISKTLSSIEKEMRNYMSDKKERMKKFENSIDIKVELSDVQKLMSNLNAELLSHIEQTKSDFQALLQIQEEECRKELDKKISVHEVSTVMIEKVDKSEMYQAMADKLDKLQFKGVSDAFEELSEKAKIFDEGMLIINKLHDKVDTFSQELLKKSDIKDVCSLLDMKAGIDDVNKSLLEMHNDITQKTKVQDESVRAIMDQVQSIDLGNISGRWMWKSGELKGGNGIPWELQVCNTSMETFLWEKDKTGIVVAEDGMYEVALVIFASGKPITQLLVNGEPLGLEAKGNQSFSSSIGKVKALSSKKSFSGSSVCGYLSLPSKVRISASYVGEPNAEGFISLRRLI